MKNENEISLLVISILTNEIIAANNKILTKRSSNCSSTNCHIDLPSSAGSSVNIMKKNKRDYSLINWFNQIVVKLQQ